MKFDFLSLLESIVLGFVSFVYSVARSIYAILRRPVRGPLRLYGRYRIPHYRQIGGVTFLYLAFFLTQYLVSKSQDFTSSAVLDELWAAIVALPTIGQEDLWPILAGSLIGTTIVDAAIRLFAGSGVRRRSRREMIVAASEYSLFLAVPPAGFVAWYLPALRCPDIVTQVPLWVIVGPLLVAVASLPAAMILRTAFWQRSGGVQAEATRRARSPALVLSVALPILMIGAAYAAVHLTVAIGGDEDVCYLA